MTHFQNNVITVVIKVLSLYDLSQGKSTNKCEIETKFMLSGCFFALAEINLRQRLFHKLTLAPKRRTHEFGWLPSTDCF